MAQAPLVGVIMGSQSDWETMQHASAMLALLEESGQDRRLGEDNIQAVAKYSLSAGLAGFDALLSGTLA